MLLVDQWLRERPPGPGLASTLRCGWSGDLGAMRLPLPDECYDLVWVSDSSLWLSGPESASWPHWDPPGTTAVGVRFQPGAGPAVFRIAAPELLDTRIRLEDFWPARQVRELAGRLAEQPDDAGRIRLLEAAVRQLAASAPPGDPVARQAAAAVGQVRPVSARDVAHAAGLSPRQIHRHCQSAFGYGPAVRARILRLQRALRLARSWHRPARLADLAIEAGYSDQQHLAHDVRAITGTTASDLFAPGVRSVQDAPPGRSDDAGMTLFTGQRRALRARQVAGRPAARAS